MNWTEAARLAETHGPSFFVFDEARFRDNMTRFQAAFRACYPKVRIGYSYKTNYTPYLCRIADELGAFAEVVSEMEYDQARSLGIPAERVIFNGPYKACAAFEDAMLGGAILNLDSHRDVEMVTAIAAAHPDQEFGVVLRCNFALEEGHLSRFGFDVEGDEFAAAVKALRGAPNTRLSGLHCHFPHRDLESYRRRAARMIALASDLFPDSPPDYINIGGGYFSTMPPALAATFSSRLASFDDYGRTIGGMLSEAFGTSEGAPTLIMEPGTAMVADTLHFVTQVISKKTIRGTRIATVAGSLFDASPHAKSTSLPCEALLQPGRDRAAPEAHMVAGYTCIEKDILAHALKAPLLVDDFLSFGNLGSYSVVMKPPFILPANPVLAKTADGEYTLIKRRETREYIFQNFVK